MEFCPTSHGRDVVQSGTAVFVFVAGVEVKVAFRRLLQQLNIVLLQLGIRCYAAQHALLEPKSAARCISINCTKLVWHAGPLLVEREHHRERRGRRSPS